MGTLTHHFRLDSSTFNQRLYSEILDLWYNGSPVETVIPNKTFLSRWWGAGVTKEESTAFDGECRMRFGRALESIGPSHLMLPPFESHEQDVTIAETIARPFLDEVKTAHQKSARQGAETLLSLILLLDQITRNIYRDQNGLRLVYDHYDRLAVGLLRGSLAMQPSPARHPVWRGKSAIQTWLAMPLIHIEHLPSLKKQAEWLILLRGECEGLGSEADVDYVWRAEKAHIEHCEPIARFGRYPHRNEALGRANTPEETEYLKTANTFGVKQGNKPDEKL